MHFFIRLSCSDFDDAIKAPYYPREFRVTRCMRCSLRDGYNRGVYSTLKYRQRAGVYAHTRQLESNPVDLPLCYFFALYSRR